MTDKEYKLKLVRNEYYSTPEEAIDAYHKDHDDNDIVNFLIWFFDTLELTKSEYAEFEKIYKEHVHQNRTRFIEGYSGTMNDIIEKFKAEVTDVECTLNSIATWLFIPVGETGEIEIMNNMGELFGSV